MTLQKIINFLALATSGTKRRKMYKSQDNARELGLPYYYDVRGKKRSVITDELVFIGVYNGHRVMQNVRGCILHDFTQEENKKKTEQRLAEAKSSGAWVYQPLQETHTAPGCMSPYKAVDADVYYEKETFSGLACSFDEYFKPLKEKKSEGNRVELEWDRKADVILHSKKFGIWRKMNRDDYHKYHDAIKEIPSCVNCLIESKNISKRKYMLDRFDGYTDTIAKSLGVNKDVVLEKIGDIYNSDSYYDWLQAWHES